MGITVGQARAAKRRRVATAKPAVTKAVSSMSAEVLPRFAIVTEEEEVVPLPIKLEQVPPLTAGAFMTLRVKGSSSSVIQTFRSRK